jgi:hypothetical protein
MKTRYWISISAFSVIVLMFWYGGADFLNRNPLNAYMLFVAVFVAIGTYTFPVKFKDEEKD